MSLLLIILVSSSICPEGEKYSSRSQTCKPSLRYIKSYNTNKVSCPWCNLRPENEEIKKENLTFDDSDSGFQDGVDVPAPALLNILDIPKYAAEMKKNKATIYKLNSAEEKQLLPKIRQILNQNTDEVEHEDTDNIPAKNEPNGRSVLVKRIVPHNYVTGEYEYDSKLNTVYRPLARYHVPNPEEEQITTLLKQIAAEKKHKDRSAKDLVVFVQEEEVKKNLLDQIDKYLSQNMEQQKRKKVTGIELLKSLGKEALMSLRQPDDPYAYGRLPPDMIPLPKIDAQVETVVPTYPFWDYWTYSKPIAQDRCPGNLVRLGNMCISPLGHRRSADPYDARRRSSHHNKQRRSIRASRKKHLYGSRM
ncbi:hypothetical protein PYW08_009047 [Mythimna loreyi]|uniref:Uncharacterized protein n=1 Tax=Mythimna loreyi TaxID=667449 RepID=A0ACC2QCE9_9NEOP|nr:hypothetical protein PYW08_009047 [Mythimna loreyi]